MSKRRLVDTNLIVRYLVQDHEKHSKAAGKLFDACDRGDVVVTVLPAVLAECVFGLESFYEHPRGPGAAEIGGATIHFDALERYRKGRSISWTACSPRPRRPKPHRWPPSIRIFESSPTCA